MLQRRKKPKVSFYTHTPSPPRSPPVTPPPPNPEGYCSYCPPSPLTLLHFTGEMNVCTNCGVVQGSFITEDSNQKEFMKDKDTGLSTHDLICGKERRTLHTIEVARKQHQLEIKAARVDPGVKISEDILKSRHLITKWAERAHLPFERTPCEEQFITLSTKFYETMDHRVNGFELRTAVLWYEASLLRGATALTPDTVIQASDVTAIEFYNTLRKVAKVLHPHVKTSKLSTAEQRLKTFYTTVEQLVHAYRGPAYLDINSKVESRVLKQLALFQTDCAKVSTRVPKTVACAILYLATRRMQFIGKGGPVTASLLGKAVGCAPSAIRTCAKFIPDAFARHRHNSNE
jgi:transcription initiation factor TFIIIB Brf1 subunit/transcription initiation factor TFIIB